MVGEFWFLFSEKGLPVDTCDGGVEDVGGDGGESVCDCELLPWFFIFYCDSSLLGLADISSGKFASGVSPGVVGGLEVSSLT